MKENEFLILTNLFFTMIFPWLDKKHTFRIRKVVLEKTLSLHVEVMQEHRK